MTKNKTDLNNLSEILDKIDAESPDEEITSQAVSTSKRGDKSKVDLSNLEDILDKIDREAEDAVEIKIEVIIGGKTMGSRMNWSKAGISNHEIVESKSRSSNAIHNSYDGVCSFCGKTVDSKQGLLEMLEGKWSVIHPDCAIKRNKKRKARNG